MTSKDLKALRKRLSMTQAEFVLFLDVPYRTYVKWESGENKITPIASTCFKMLAYLIDNGLLDDYINDT